MSLLKEVPGFTDDSVINFEITNGNTYQESIIFYLLYDVTNRKSFEQIPQFVKGIQCTHEQVYRCNFI